MIIRKWKIIHLEIFIEGRERIFRNNRTGDDVPFGITEHSTMIIWRAGSKFDQTCP